MPHQKTINELTRTIHELRWILRWLFDFPPTPSDSLLATYLFLLFVLLCVISWIPLLNSRQKTDPRTPTNKRHGLVTPCGRCFTILQPSKVELIDVVFVKDEWLAETHFVLNHLNSSEAT